MTCARSRRQCVIDREGLAAPGADGGPGLRRGGPELIRCWQAERQQAHRAQVQAAGGDIGLSNPRLVTAEPDPKPAIGIEGAWGFDGAFDHTGQRAADLRRRDIFGQRAPERGLRQEVERAEAVRDANGRLPGMFPRERSGVPGWPRIARRAREPARRALSMQAFLRDTRRARRRASAGSRSCCNSPSGRTGRRRRDRHPCTTGRAAAARSPRACDPSWRRASRARPRQSRQTAASC